MISPFHHQKADALPGMIESTLTITYLEMTNPGEFRPAYSSDPALNIMESVIPLVSFYRFLYNTVGAPWRWYDRRALSDEQLEAQLSQPHINVYVLYVSGTPAGYIELDRQPDNSTEVAYFGLIQKFFGRGYGKHLLSFGVQRAWDMGAKRVWVHTCNLDGPAAMPTYQACGFRIYDVTEQPMPAKYLAPT
jgi:GNAT superfamily N-acetyltransferase